MSDFKAKYVLVATLLVIIATGSVLMFFRPSIIPVASFQAAFSALMSSMSGRNAGETSAGSGAGADGGGSGNQVTEQKEIYLIELKTGGRVYTDNLKTGDGKLTYETASGLMITINSYEVLGIRKFKEGEEPER